MTEAKNESNPFILPKEIWKEIILLLDPKDIATTRQMNNFFKKLADSISIKEYYGNRPNNIPLNWKKFLSNKLQKDQITADVHLTPSLMELYQSEKLKLYFSNEFSASPSNENDYKKNISLLHQTKEAMLKNDFQQVVSWADKSRDNLINFIQRENELPKKLRLGTLIACFAIAAGYLVFYTQANFMKRFPSECDIYFSLSDCQHQVDEFFTKSMFFWFLTPTLLGAGLKSFENSLFKKLASKLINSLMLPRLDYSHLSGTFRNYLGKTAEKRDYISLVASLCLLLILKMSNMATFDIKNCIVPNDIISYIFDPACLDSNLFRINHHHIAPMSSSAGFFFAYSVMTLMVLTWAAAKKACAAFKDCYNSHGFLGRNNTGESFALLDTQPQPQANYSAIPPV